MARHLLTVNSGSSSLKFGLFAADGPTLLLSGQIDRIGAAAEIKAKSADGEKMPPRALAAEAARDHTGALGAVLDLLQEAAPEAEIAAVGHRIVHGGTEFAAPVALTPALMEKLEALSSFAPLHQPHNLAGVRAAHTAFPDALQVGCFDTAFHRGQPLANDLFALPWSYYEAGVRRYGFHGLSYDYIAGALAESDPELHSGRVVVAHLGNGASMCAITGGRSVGSTMGFTALDGLPMGTRCGQIDPGVILYLMETEGLGAVEISDLLYRRSGLLGLSGLSNDMRTLEGAGTPEAERAIDYFVFRIRRELGALAAVLGGLDALVFCGGIGENSRTVRARVCEGMDWLGIAIDPERNAANARRLSPDDARATVLKIDTDEEIVIARAAASLLGVHGA